MPKATTKPTTTEEQGPDYEAVTKMLAEYRESWNKQFTESGMDAVKFSRLSVVALTQIAAIVAVDVGMTVDQFSNVCRAQFTEAHKRAPRFG